MGVSIDRPKSQVQVVRAAKVLLHADFRYNDNLGFRLGVPIEAKMEKRDATETMGERQKLKWTLPVFAATVLKFE